ncbi:MAG: DUF5808 domain-containing protein [Thermoplasmata archaeon]|nr:DUF5808 domain-containing protein [Thermoplasmata archaeon]
MIPVDGLTLALLIPLPVLAYVTWALPDVAPTSLSFGVRVPPSEQEAPGLREIRRSYRRNWLAVSLGLLAPVLLLFLLAARPENLLWLELAVVPYFLVYFAAHRRVRELKRAKRWAPSAQAIAVVAVGDPDPDDGMMLGAIAPIAVLLATLIVGILRYAGAPALLPVHFGPSGTPDSYAPKSLDVFFIPVEISAFVTALLLGLTYLVLRAPVRLDPSSPEQAALRSHVFRQRMSAGLFGLGAVVNLVLLIEGLAVWGLVTPGPTFVAVPLILLLGYSASFAFVAVRTGQMGSRVAVGEVAPPLASRIPRDDDRYWRAGVFYYNPEDPALFVPKRVGVGWTLNFARPVAWVIILLPPLFGIGLSLAIHRW